ncbi:MAG TPA: beta-propeller fold lactonase family protein [Patescibacteria group bacterium]|nr:beta-propeller fold lactonase family protein [Patescibacteria group bacterium]
MALLVLTLPVAAEVVPTVTFTGPATYTPGSATASTYTLVLGNTGTTTESSASVDTDFPGGGSISWSCGSATGGATCPGGGGSSGTGNLNNKDPGSLPQNGTVTYTFSVTFASSLTTTPLVVTASMNDSEAGADDDTDSDAVSSTRSPSSDWGVSFPGTPTAYVPGSSGAANNLSLTVTNLGPTDGSATLSLPVPTGATVGSWACSPLAACSPQTGTGDVSTTVTRVDDAAVTINLTSVSYLSSLTTSPLVWTATVDGADDGSTGNDTATKSLTRTPKTDYAVGLVPSRPTSAPGTYVPGSTGNALTIHVTNNGPTDSGAVPISMTLPTGVTGTWSCAPASACSPSIGSGNVATNVTLANDASVDIDLSLAYASNLLLAIDLTASATVASGEDDFPLSNSATNRYNADRRADVQVTHAPGSPFNPTSVNPGGVLHYAFTVTNSGDSDVGNGAGEIGVRLNDTFPSALQGDPAKCADTSRPCWAYCPSDAGVAGTALTVATCPAGVEISVGPGNLVDAGLKLRKGSSSRVEVYTQVSGTASGSITNTATVSIAESAVTDPDGTDNSSSLTTAIQIGTNVSVSKTDGKTSANAGAMDTYTITVSNTGTSTANNVTVADVLPIYPAATAGFLAGSISWQCSASAGACCNSNSANCGVGTPTAAITANALNAAIDLSPASSVVFTVTGRINARASGTLSNTATATMPAGVTDSNPSDNTATDTTTIGASGSFAITKELTSLGSVAPGGSGAPYQLVYRIVASNGGPSFIDNAVLADALGSANLDNSTASWTCVTLTNPAGGNTGCAAAAGSGAPSLQVDLDPGGAVAMTVTVNTIAAPSGPVNNTATITGPGSSGSASAQLSSSLSGQADLALEITDFQTTAIPGDDTDYVVTVSNAGPDDVFGARVRGPAPGDLFPSALESVAWTCEATTPIPGDLNPYGTFGASNTAGNAVVASSDGRHVYVVSTATHTVHAFQRDNVPGASFGSVAVLEVETNDVNDPLDGGSTVTDMAGPRDIALSADGALLYVLSQTAIVSFNRVNNPSDPNYGRIAYAGSVSAGLPTTPRRLLVTAQNLYVSGDAVVSIYRRDPVSGLPVHDVQFGANMPAAPAAMAVSTTDALLFVASSTDNDIAAFTINTTAGAIPLGRLTARAALLTDVDVNSATDLVVAPAERHLYVASGAAGKLAMLGYTTTSLSKVFTYADPVAGAPDPLAGSLHLALAPDGEHLLVAGNGGYLLRYRRDVFAGGLSFEQQLATDASNPGLAGAAGIVVSSDGRHVLIASASTSTPPLTVYGRRAPDPRFAFVERDRQGDALAGGGTLPGLTAVSDVVVSADGEHVYAISLQDHTLVAFTRNSTKGLDPATAGQHLVYLAHYSEGGSGISGLNRPSQIQVSADGRSVFVTSEESNTLAVFDREATKASPNFGRLTFRQKLQDGVGGVDGLLGARGIALDQGGQHVYVAGSFESAIAIFRRESNGNLGYLASVRGGSDGVTGLNGIRDLVVSRDGAQLLGVSAIANAVVAFNREQNAVSPNYGRLSFVQARTLGSTDRLVALSLPESTTASDNEHVYVVAEGGHRLYVLRRNLDPGSASYGTVQLQFQYANNSGGIARMNGPRDVRVSPDGERVYVGAQFGHSVLVFDRETNRSSATYGALSLVETRSDGVDGVDGLNSVYALAVSPLDSRNVYVAGFGDNAIASFVVGTGSSCSASGSGDIDDLVDIGRNGTLVYRVQARIRPDATGDLTTTATVESPLRFSDDDNTNNTRTDTTSLTPRADLSVSKTNDRVSVVAGETVTYEVVVRNGGLSNIVQNLSLTDLMGAGAGFVPGSATWSCVASGSGALDFIDRHVDDQNGITGLGGIGGLVLVNDLDGAGPLPAYLAGAGVLDDSLVVFARDDVDGRLTQVAHIAQGSTLNSVPVGGLAGARTVAASPDGQFLYVVGRTSDALSVFKLSDNGSGQLRVDLVQTETGRVGLDQSLQVVLSPEVGAGHVYVVGANDDAIAVFSRDAVTGLVTWIESEQNGINDASDGGGLVAGLDGVEYLVLSPDGRQAYALSGAGGSVAAFDRDTSSGRLSWRGVQDGIGLGAPMAGASSATFSADGASLYITAADDNALVVLDRDNAPASSGFGNLSYADSLVQDIDGVQGLLAPTRAALSGDGTHLYVTARSGGSVAWFIRDPADGSLRFLGLRSNESAGVDGLAGATDVVIDSDLNQIYVAGTQQSALVQFERQSDTYCPPNGSGDLVAIPMRIAAGGNVTFTISVDVATNHSGALVNTATIDAGSSPNQDITPDNNSAVDNDSVSVVADLAITKSDGLAEFDGLAGAAAMTGDDAQVYAAGGGDNAIGAYDRAVDGSLSFNSVIRGGSGGVLGLAGVNDVLLSSDGDHVYATSASESSVSVFNRNRGSGALSFVEIEQNGVFGVTGLSGARALAMSPDGAHVYVVGGFSNAVAVFTRQTDSGSADYGRLSYRGVVQNGVSGVDGIGDPVAVQVSPDGRHVYVLGDANDSIAVFARNPNPGSSGYGLLSYSVRYLNNVGGFSGLAGVRSLLINNAGTQVYVLAAETGHLTRLVRDVSTGALTPGQVLTNGRAGSEGENALAPSEADGLPGTSGLLGASRMRWSSDQAQIYVAATESDAIARFAVNVGDGAVSFVDRINNGDAAPLTGGQVLGLDGVRDVFAAADGLHLYSVSAVDAAANSFVRTPADGALGYAASLFDGLGGVAPGDSVTYTITATNLGPSNVSGAIVTDQFPDVFSGITWTCTASDNDPNACPSSGTGSLSASVNLLVGQSVVFSATGVVGDGASGRLVNTATISSNGNLDPVSGNDSATDGDTVLSPAMDLVVAITDSVGVAVPGNRIDYGVTIDNLGPTYADDAVVSDLIPAALYNVAWTCSAVPVAGVVNLTQQIVAPATDFTAVAIGSTGNHVYAAGMRGGLGAVIAYRRNPLDGALTEIGLYRDGIGGVSGLGGASDLVLSEDQRFVYVAGSTSDAIAVFARNADSGLLTYVSKYQDGSAGIDGLGGVRALLLSPGGAHLYAAGTIDDAVAVFSVNVSTGLLAPASVLRQSDAGLDGLNGVIDLAWGNDGSHLLAVAPANQSLAAFARNAGTGALTPAALLQDFQLPTSGGVLADPNALLVQGDQVFVASSANHRVSRFRFATTPGAAFTLDASIVNGQAGVVGMLLPDAFAYDSDQARLYVGSQGGGLHLFSLIGAQPQLLESRVAAASPVLTGVRAMALSHHVRQLYTLGTSPGGIGVWARERGSRCPAAGQRQIGQQTVDIAPNGHVEFQIGGDLFSNALGTLEYTVRADPRDVAEELNPADNVATNSNVLQPQPDLSVSKTDGLTEVVAGLPLQYDIDVANAGVSDALLARVGDLVPEFPTATAGIRSGSANWSCSANAPLEFTRTATVTTDAALAGVTAMALSPGGTRLYAVNPATSALLVLPRAADGSLSAAQVIQNGSVLGETTVDGLAGASGVALTPDGRHLLVTAATANSLLVFSRETDGSLRFRQKLTSGSGGVVGLLGATDVVVSLDGKRVFVASSVSHAIAVFTRDAVTGQLAFVERVADGIGTILPDSNVIRGVRRLHLTADGAHLYAVSTLSSALSRFDVNGATGRLTYRGALRSSGAGLSALAGARDVVATPGDTHLYALGSSGVVGFARAGDGSLSPVAGGASTIAGTVDARALTLDAFGARLYVADADAKIHVFARDWTSGALDYRAGFTASGGLLAAPNELLHVPASDDLYVSSAQPGAIVQLDELPLSRCLSDGGTQTPVGVDVDLGVGGWAELRIDATVHPSARGTLANTATVTPGGAGVDPQTVNNSATDQTLIRVVSDLHLTKTGPDQAVAGTDIQYQVQLRNSGPSNALGVQVSDVLPVALLDATWTCSSSGASVCPASGSGSIAFTTDVLAGDTLTLDITARVSPAYVGTMTNTASVVAEAGATDPTPGDHDASVQTTVVARPDVAVTKTDGVNSVVAGTAVSYQIDVVNHGPSDAPQVRVLDALPPNLLAATWTCTATGTTCPANGSGSPDFEAAMPTGSSLQLVVNATLSSAATGSLVNTATAQVQGVAVDPQPDNNSATDTDLISIVPDLALSIVDLFDPYDQGGTVPLPYRVTITNAGPSDAHGVILELTQSRIIGATIPPNCVVVGSSVLMTCTFGTVPAGSAIVVQFDYAGMPITESVFSVEGIVTTIDADPNLDNNMASQSTQLLAGASVRVSISDSLGVVPMGYRTTYRVVVENVGSVTGNGIVVDVPIATGLLGATWTCSSPNGANCAAAGTGAVVDTVTLARGQSVVYLLSATVDPALDPSGPLTITQTASISGGADIYGGDNAASDVDLVTPVLFADGFETTPIAHATQAVPGEPCADATCPLPSSHSRDSTMDAR